MLQNASVKNPSNKPPSAKPNGKCVWRKIRIPTSIKIFLSSHAQKVGRTPSALVRRAIRDKRVTIPHLKSYRFANITADTFIWLKFTEWEYEKLKEYCKSWNIPLWRGITWLCGNHFSVFDKPKPKENQQQSSSSPTRPKASQHQRPNAVPHTYQINVPTSVPNSTTHTSPNPQQNQHFHPSNPSDTENSFLNKITSSSSSYLSHNLHLLDTPQRKEEMMIGRVPGDVTLKPPDKEPNTEKSKEKTELERRDLVEKRDVVAKRSYETEGSYETEKSYEVRGEKCEVGRRESWCEVSEVLASGVSEALACERANERASEGTDEVTSEGTGEETDWETSEEEGNYGSGRRLGGSCVGGDSICVGGGDGEVGGDGTMVSEGREKEGDENEELGENTAAAGGVVHMNTGFGETGGQGCVGADEGLGSAQETASDVVYTYKVFDEKVRSEVGAEVSAYFADGLRPDEPLRGYDEERARSRLERLRKLYEEHPLKRFFERVKNEGFPLPKDRNDLKELLLWWWRSDKTFSVFARHRVDPEAFMRDVEQLFSEGEIDDDKVKLVKVIHFISKLNALQADAWRKILLCEGDWLPLGLEAQLVCYPPLSEYTVPEYIVLYFMPTEGKSVLGTLAALGLISYDDILALTGKFVFRYSSQLYDFLKKYVLPRLNHILKGVRMRWPLSEVSLSYWYFGSEDPEDSLPSRDRGTFWRWLRLPKLPSSSVRDVLNHVFNLRRLVWVDGHNPMAVWERVRSKFSFTVDVIKELQEKSRGFKLFNLDGLSDEEARQVIFYALVLFVGVNEYRAYKIASTYHPEFINFCLFVFLYWKSANVYLNPAGYFVTMLKRGSFVRILRQFCKMYGMKVKFRVYWEKKDFVPQAVGL